MGVGEEFAVSSDGMEMFGVLDLVLETSLDGCRFAIGIRNANNKRFRLALRGRFASIRLPQSCFSWGLYSGLSKAFEAHLRF